MKTGFFSNKSFIVKVFITLLTIFAGFCFTMLFTAITTLIAYPDDILSGTAPMLSANILRAVQTYQTICLFIIPAIFLAVCFDSNPKGYLYLEQRNKPLIILLTIIASVIIIPFINWLAYFNQQMHFPEALKGIEQWMRNSEADANSVMEVMLKMDSVGALLINIILIGALAAVSEEILFRGIIQRIIADANKNIHVGIGVSALIFSAIHLQFYGFFPRLLLGAYFGYLLWWTKSLWMPILAHFVNNFIAVIGSYLEQKGIVTDTEWKTVGSFETIVSIISLLIFGIIVWMIYNRTKSIVPAKG